MEDDSKDEVATTFVGVSGTGLISMDGEVDEDVPVALIAVIVNV